MKNLCFEAHEAIADAVHGFTVSRSAVCMIIDDMENALSSGALPRSMETTIRSWCNVLMLSNGRMFEEENALADVMSVLEVGA